MLGLSRLSGLQSCYRNGLRPVATLGNLNNMIRMATNATNSKVDSNGNIVDKTEVEKTFYDHKTQITISDPVDTSSYNPNMHLIPKDLWTDELRNLLETPKIKFIIKENGKQFVNIDHKYFSDKLIGNKMTKAQTKSSSLKCTIRTYIEHAGTYAIFCSGVMTFPGLFVFVIFAHNHPETIAEYAIMGGFGSASLAGAAGLMLMFRAVSKDATTRATILNGLIDSICQKQNIVQNPMTTLYFDSRNNQNIPGPSLNINFKYNEFIKIFKQTVSPNHELLNLSKSNIDQCTNSIEMYIMQKNILSEPIILSDKLAWKIAFWSLFCNSVKSVTRNQQMSVAEWNTTLKLIIGSLFPAIIAGSCGVPVFMLPVIASVYPVCSSVNYRNKIARMIRYFEHQTLNQNK